MNRSIDDGGPPPREEKPKREKVVLDTGPAPDKKTRDEANKANANEADAKSVSRWRRKK